MEVIIALLILIIVALIFLLFKNNREIKTYNDNIDKLTDEAKRRYNEALQEEIKKKEEFDLWVEEQQTHKNKVLTNIQQEIAQYNTFKTMNEEQLKQLKESLEAEVQEYKNLMDNAYADRQMELSLKIQNQAAELQKLAKTRESAIAAMQKEEEIKQKKAFYSLSINEKDLIDIKILKDIEYKLNNPRVLRMLIWTTFFQKPMGELCDRVLGLKSKIGIYKITNQINSQAYIGQSIDISKRWKEHAKCGLGIDASPTNKLYKAMVEDGLWNFTFELLEECPRAELNEKERFYIDLYKSNNFGYNSTKGTI